MARAPLLVPAAAFVGAIALAGVGTPGTCALAAAGAAGLAWPRTRLPAAAALLAINEWALRPVMVAARTHGVYAGLTFGAWHGVSFALYALASIAMLVLIWRQDFR